ncbi:MAG: hypothetical protein OEV64_06430 [Desulfobulbaceae bacterium]|nr:hypothetical protein [Desulfobulbaceae bacterium]
MKQGDQKNANFLLLPIQQHLDLIEKSEKKTVQEQWKNITPKRPGREKKRRYYDKERHQRVWKPSPPLYVEQWYFRREKSL